MMWQFFSNIPADNPVFLLLKILQPTVTGEYKGNLGKRKRDEVGLEEKLFKLFAAEILKLIPESHFYECIRHKKCIY